MDVFNIFFVRIFYDQDKADAHKKLLDDAEEHFLFKEEARDLVKSFIF